MDLSKIKTGDNPPDDINVLIEVPLGGDPIILWESWLRHEVPANMGEEPRLSISFNYALKRD